jgi:hypothetical protein
MVDGLDICETNMTIPLNPTEPWMGTVVGSEHDTTVDQMAHIALISLCESRLVATAAMPNVLFLSQNQKSLVLKQHLEAVSDLEGPHFNTGMAAMAMYVQYLYNLQRNTARTVMQQHTHLTAYEEHSTAISCEFEQLRQENVILHSGKLPPLDQDRELKVAYHLLSEAEHGWNYTH